MEFAFTDLASHAFAASFDGEQGCDRVNPGAEPEGFPPEPVGEPIADCRRVYVKTGTLERRSILRIGNLEQGPYYSERAVKSPFFGRTVQAVDVPYLNLARRSFPKNLVTG